MNFKEWVDEYFANSSIDLEILLKAYNALVPEGQQVNNLDDVINEDD